MIKVILWDIDGTLLNFKAAEKNAIHKGFERYNLGLCTEEMLARYSAINRTYWERLERGEISKQEVLLGRFREFFAQEGLPVEQAAHFNESYQLDLGETCIFCDNGKELVKELKELGYRQYAVTNGTRTAQRKKLVRSGLGEMLDGAFISDEIGVEKPMKGFFDKVFSSIGNYGKDEMLIVGDSLSSDMRGGNHAGILCCWYNPEHKENKTDVKIDFEISRLQQIKEVILQV